MLKAIVLLWLLSFSGIAIACPDCQPKGGSPQKEWLDAHNKHRVSRGKNIPPLQWDDRVMNSAKQWAKHLASECKMYHAKNPGYGENLAAAWGSKNPRPIADVVQSWMDEEKAFKGPAYPWCKNGQVCGHLTQILWKKTKFLGCWRESCVIPKGDWKGKMKHISVCRYDPPGNFRGQPVY
jgi:hypothetical protein